MLQWIAPVTGLITVVAAGIAAWRYLFALHLPLSVIILDTFLCEAGFEGRLVSKSTFYSYRLKNVGRGDVQIATIMLQRPGRIGWVWPRANCTRLDSGGLPCRIQPNEGIDVPVQIERAHVGTYRLLLRSCGSVRYMILALPELERVPAMST